MSGIYIHVPFCSQACNYCDFHFATSTRLKNEMVDAICEEILMRKNYLPDNHLKSIYFGGGTPSLLEAKDIESIIHVIFRHFDVDHQAEITLEANPENLSRKYLSQLKTIHINRLSIGIQSFRDEDLRFMNRAHDAPQAERCILDALETGFSNISIDLIFGIPGLAENDWKANLEKAASFPVTHLSCYGLTVEGGTPLAKAIARKQSPAPDEDESARQFEILMRIADEQGFEHYEISNFCRNNQYAVHNTSYWKNIPYLGVGPSAHSYDGKSRRKNLPNNYQYIQGIKNQMIPHEEEILSVNSAFNEKMLTGLRTKWGIEKSFFFDKELSIKEKFFSLAHSFIKQGLMKENPESFTLTDKGFLMADRIASDFFI